jgi:hypothetical protein
MVRLLVDNSDFLQIPSYHCSCIPQSQVWVKFMIEVLRVKSCGLSFSDTFNVLVSCERILEEEILLAQETFSFDIVLFVDSINES